MSSHIQATTDINPAALPTPTPIFVPKPLSAGACGASGCGAAGVAAVGSEVDEAAAVEMVGFVNGDNVEIDVDREADTIDVRGTFDKEVLLSGAKVRATVELLS